MKDEYDFTNAEQGKFYRPIEELDIPIYLDKEIRECLIKRMKTKESQFSLSQIVNSLIRKNIEISREIVLEPAPDLPTGRGEV